MLYLCKAIIRCNETSTNEYMIIAANSYEAAVKHMTSTYNNASIEKIEALQEIGNIIFLTKQLYKEVLYENFLER